MGECFFFLPDAVDPIDALVIDRGVPGGIDDDDAVCLCEVETQASHPRCQKEEGDGGIPEQRMRERERETGGGEKVSHGWPSVAFVESLPWETTV